MKLSDKILEAMAGLSLEEEVKVEQGQARTSVVFFLLLLGVVLAVFLSLSEVSDVFIFVVM